MTKRTHTQHLYFKSPVSFFSCHPLPKCQPSESATHNQNIDPNISRTKSLLPSLTPASHTKITGCYPHSCLWSWGLADKELLH